jgi:hypothetical protein
VDLEPVKVANNEEGRILQRFPVLQELAVGGLEVPLLAFVLPAEVTALPHISPAISTSDLFRALLEGVGLPGRVLIGGRR